MLEGKSQVDPETHVINVLAPPQYARTERVV